MKQSFLDMCINTKSSNPFIDDGYSWCRLLDGYQECAYEGRWNECPDYNPVRLAIKNLK